MSILTVMGNAKASECRMDNEVFFLALFLFLTRIAEGSDPPKNIPIMAKGKHLTLLFCILPLVAIFTSCSKDELDDTGTLIPGKDYPTTETVTGGTITYQYKNDVTVIDEHNKNYLLKIESDTILFFSKDAKRHIKLEENGIISSAITNELMPYGIGNKILSIIDEGNYLKCVTSPTSLDNIFEELNINADIELVCDTISNRVEDVDGNIISISISNQDNQGRASIGSPNILTINFGNKSNESRIGPYINGSVNLGAVATIDINLKEHKSECSLALYAGMEGEIGTQGTWSGYKKILPRAGKWNIATGVVSLGPVVLRPYIDAEFGVEGKIEGTISTKISKQFGGKFGLKNGQLFHENLTSSDTDIIKNISVNAKGEINFVTSLDFGIGLYTKNIAAGIEPSISAGVSTDFKLNNENLFRNHPNLDFSITADADAFFFATFFGKEFTHEQATLASINLFTYSWPLLPSLVENSLKINKRDYNGPLAFDCEYKLQGGLLTDLSNKLGNYTDIFTIIPSFRVYRGGNEVYHMIDNQEINGSGIHTFKYELEDLEHDISYTGKPCLIIGNNIYDENGTPFSSTSPTAAITDIVQTGAAEGEFYHNGSSYKHEFYFYINTQIKGSDNCSEWGIYAPNSPQIYNPSPLKDGRYTQYWTAWSDKSSASFSKTPYAVLKEDGSIKYFEQHLHILYYGGRSSNPAKSQEFKSSSNGLKIIDDGELIMRLDSIRYEGL